MNQQFIGMFEFLQRVLYIPNPNIKVAKAASGIKMNTLVFKPITDDKDMDIKLSHS